MFSEQLIAKLNSVSSLCVLTGAGISAESGIPTFRGKEGLWKNYRPEELATPEAFSNNPDMVWGWYNYRRKLIVKVNPNPGHYALVEIEKKVDDFTLITQNVDDLHRVAGSSNILELHGNIMRNRCVRCGVGNDLEKNNIHNSDPHCACGGRLRPDVVWFGEQLPQDTLWKAYSSSEKAELFLCVGTSAIVHPAASLPLAALEKGKYVVEINMETTPLSARVDEYIQGKSGDILPRLSELIGISN